MRARRCQVDSWIQVSSVVPFEPSELNSSTVSDNSFLALVSSLLALSSIDRIKIPCWLSDG